MKLSTDLELPREAVTQRFAIVGRTGAGKSHSAKVLVEELVKAQLPVVMLDPMGVFWGLRSSRDGQGPGLPVTILGGEHGDVPLDPAAGAAVADLVVAHPGAYVVDTSAFDSDAEEDRFVEAFAARLYRAKASDRRPLMLVVDEADRFAPQQPFSDQKKMLHAMNSLMRRARVRGVGMTVVTQRPAALSKNVLTQAEVLVVHQLTAPQDRTAVDEWVKLHGSGEERAAVLASLAELATGECWVWSPSWLKTLLRVTIRRTETFDSSATPEPGAAVVEPEWRADVDLEALRDRFAEAIAVAEESDPDVLRERVRALEAKLESGPEPDELKRLRGRISELAQENARLATRPERMGVIQPRGLESLKNLIAEVRSFREGLAQWIEAGFLRVDDDVTEEELQAFAAELGTTVGRERAAPPTTPTRQSTRSTPAPTWSAPPPAADPDLQSTGSTDGIPAASALPKGSRSVLQALVQSGGEATGRKVALVSGYSIRSSTLRNICSDLRQRGLVEGSHTGTLRATPDGLSVPGLDRLPSDEEVLRAYWLDKVPGGAPEGILRALIERYPDAMDLDGIEMATGYSAKSSTVRNALSTLRGLDLIDGPNDRCRASAELFGDSP